MKGEASRSSNKKDNKLPELNYLHDFTFHKNMFPSQGGMEKGNESDDQEKISTKNTSMTFHLYQ